MFSPLFVARFPRTAVFGLGMVSHMAQLPPHRIWLHNGVLRDPEAPAAEEGGVLVVDGRITASEQSGE